ncbi:hypothetical protein 2AV2_47 [Nodularia phage vB_NpeS-2AV2]|uniref:Uncharacterized protein n=1 Tax=Nodularia phage vB_NpeS-2AV2 TaxID=1777122 RepID=A0A1L2BWT0_9CAUD|nr:hypothetical protein HWA92_gp047 [Nodularia phage vB_NpeS-2AV2]ALY07499.1 hypothetical protein 2AV2_47 [Nodularia phage vB_NpeS-2AV2]
MIIVRGDRFRDVRVCCLLLIGAKKWWVVTGNSKLLKICSTNVWTTRAKNKLKGRSPWVY